MVYSPAAAREPWRKWVVRAGLLSLWLTLVGATAMAQEPAARLSLGVAGHLVAGAWNPLVLETRDLPPSTLTLLLDAGTLQSGEVPITLTHELGGGGGSRFYETDLFVPPFHSLAWRVTTADRVVASGSLSGRDSDSRGLVVLLQGPGVSETAARARAEWPGLRLVEARASELPSAPAAYDGVAALVVDQVAPPAPALVAAAVAGATVVVVGGADLLPPGVADLLSGGAWVRLGAGTIGSADTTGRLAPPPAGLAALRPTDLILTALEEPLVTAPEPAPVSYVLALSVAYALLVLGLLRLGGGPGLASLLLVSVLAGAGGWWALRPQGPRVEGALAVGIIGGPLALLHEARETVTLPPATLTFDRGASVVRLQPYGADDAGVHVPTPAWRAATVRLPPRAVSAPFTLQGGTISNASTTPLTDVYVVGLGAQPDLPGRAAARLEAGEENAFPPRYQALAQLLPAGTVVASTGCHGEGRCVIWLADAAATVDGGAERWAGAHAQAAGVRR